jgi:hypothetical protein
MEIMYLPAITLGYAVPVGDFHASVHSVFHSAMNLRLTDEESLLTLVLSSEPDLPQGIRLDTPEGFSFENFQFGEPVICREGILGFDYSGVAVQLSGARRWACDLSTLGVDSGKPSVSAAWSLVWDALNKRQQNSHAEIVADSLLGSASVTQAAILSKAGKATRELLHATQQFDLAGAAAAEGLFGLGSGLTPSGDDLLAGYMAGLWCTARNQPDRAQFIRELGNRIVDLSRRTNDISRTYLFHAVRGQVSSRLTALALAIGRGEEHDRLLQIAEQAMQHGNTSGMDTVTGLLLGISAWDALDGAYQ